MPPVHSYNTFHKTCQSINMKAITGEILQLQDGIAINVHQSCHLSNLSSVL